MYKSILVKKSYVEWRPSGPVHGWRVSVQNSKTKADCRAEQPDKCPEKQTKGW